MLITSHPGHSTVYCAGIELATFGLNLVGGGGGEGGRKNGFYAFWGGSILGKTFVFVFQFIIFILFWLENYFFSPGSIVPFIRISSLSRSFYSPPTPPPPTHTHTITTTTTTSQTRSLLDHCAANLSRNIAVYFSTECKDYADECSQYASQGYCSDYAPTTGIGTISMMCKRSCGQCSEKGE